MYLTLEKLSKIGACAQGKEYFERVFPNGAEVVDIINTRHIPHDFLHWGLSVLELNEAEQQAYRNKLNIINSGFFSYSENIDNCFYISQSKDAKDSKYIHKCSNITNSTEVIRSKDVSDSNFVYDSSFVINSNNIIDGHNINDSKNILRCKGVINSNSIFFSTQVVDSYAIEKSNYLSNCKWCSYCNNISNALFCVGLNDTSLEDCYIFNTKITQKEFDYLIKFIRFTDVDLGSFANLPKESLVETYPDTAMKIGDIYDNYDDNFFQWAKTLPHFNSEIMYGLTYNLAKSDI